MDEVEIAYDRHGMQRIITCERCEAVGHGVAPHGWNTPCPMVVQEHESHMEMMAANRAAVQAGAAAHLDLVGGLFPRPTPED